MISDRTHRFYINFLFFAGIIFGAIVSIYLKNTIFSSVVWLILSLILLIFTWIYSRKFCLILALVAGILFSFWRGSIYNFEDLKVAKFINKTEVIRAIVIEDPDLKEDGSSQIRAKVSDISGEKVNMKFFVTFKTSKKIRRSDEVVIKGKILKGFGDFSAAIKRGKLIEVIPKSDFIRDIRDSFAGGIRKFIPSPEVDLGLGYLLGQKNSLPEQLSKALTITALTHIVVASGYNLTVLVILTKFQEKLHFLVEFC